jgi:hypothetical protein
VSWAHAEGGAVSDKSTAATPAFLRKPSNPVLPHELDMSIR